MSVDQTLPSSRGRGWPRETMPQPPQLNEMASSPNSIRLDRYYSGGHVCSPTRGTVLTGRNHNSYCVWNANAGNSCDNFKCPEKKPLPLTEVTIADLLVKAG